MKSNYTTDGPWSSDSEFISSNDGFIAKLIEHDTPRETEANGRLLASAPELLASLIELEAMVAEMLPKHGPCGWGELALNQARAAIAKATGGAA